MQIKEQRSNTAALPAPPPLPLTSLFFCLTCGMPQIREVPVLRSIRIHLTRDSVDQAAVGHNSIHRRFHFFLIHDRSKPMVVPEGWVAISPPHQHHFNVTKDTLPPRWFNFCTSRYGNPWLYCRGQQACHFRSYTSRVNRENKYI